MARPLATAGYSGTPLPKKLGIKPAWKVALVDGPATFEKTLGELPDGARLLRGTRGARNLTLWFVLSRRRFEALLPGMVKFGEHSGLWICWPKKSSGVVTDLGENLIRDTAIAHGLVDFKVCAIDEIWSGLRFNRSRK